MKRMMGVVLSIVCLLAITGFDHREDQADSSLRQSTLTEKVLRVGTASNNPIVYGFIG